MRTYLAIYQRRLEAGGWSRSVEQSHIRGAFGVYAGRGMAMDASLDIGPRGTRRTEMEVRVFLHTIFWLCVDLPVAAVGIKCVGGQQSDLPSWLDGWF